MDIQATEESLERRVTLHMEHGHGACAKVRRREDLEIGAEWADERPIGTVT